MIRFLRILYVLIRYYWAKRICEREIAKNNDRQKKLLYLKEDAKINPDPDFPDELEIIEEMLAYNYGILKSWENGVRSIDTLRAILISNLKDPDFKDDLILDIFIILTVVSLYYTIF